MASESLLEARRTELLTEVSQLEEGQGGSKEQVRAKSQLSNGVSINIEKELL